MDVLTEEALQVRVGATPSRFTYYTSAAVYAVLVCAAVLHHEPWVDEAQSWLLARDASLSTLWTRLLSLEGTAGLWQTLLHALIQAGLPYSGLNVLSCGLGVAATALLLWKAPFPLAIRVALPFTFFLCYQYAVIARSYSLLPLLLFAAAALYHHAQEHAWWFTGLLCLTAAVSVHGMALAGVLGLSVLVRAPDRRRFLPQALAFAGIVSLLAAAARPAHDGTFIAGLNFSVDHFIDVTAKALSTAFTGEWITSLLVIALSLPLIWRGGSSLFFLLSSTLLCAIASVVYAQVWHHGVLFLAWLFALWIAWPSTPNTRLPYRLALFSLAIVSAVQIYWTACSISYDWQNPYSGSRAAAAGLRELSLNSDKLYAIGLACVAIEPYFPHNIFANLNEGRPESYWDWSRGNHVNEDSRHLSESQPRYVIVGYKNEFEKGVWTGLVAKSGYRLLRHFEGNTYWQTRILEPESYDLFERSRLP